MGKSARKKAEDLQTSIANTGMSTSANLQKGLVPNLDTASNYYNSIVGGNASALSKTVAPQINMANTAYDTARRQIEMNAPKGGARDASLTGLDTRKAGDVTRILQGGVSDALSHLENLGQTGLSGSLNSLGVAGNSAESIARMGAAKAQAVSSAIGGISGAAGMAMGAGQAKPTAPSGGGVGVGSPMNNVVNVAPSTSTARVPWY